MIPQAPRDVPYSIEEPAPGVWVAVAAGGGRAGANAAIIDLGDRTLVVDAGLTRAVGAWLCAVSRATTGRDPDWLLYTHAHSDHVWGAATFPPGTEICATRGTWQLFVAEAGREGEWHRAAAPAELARIDALLALEENPERRSRLEAGQAFYRGGLIELETLQVRRPTVTFDRRLLLHGSRRQVELATFGGGHTRSDAVAWVPDANLLVAGDLITVEAHPWLGGGDILEWLHILNTLHTLGAQTIVPGHGPVSDGSACTGTDEYLRCILELADGAPLFGSAAEDADDAGEALLVPPAPDEIRQWARNVPLPARWSSWAFSSFFAHNLQVLAQRLLAGLPTSLTP